MIIYAHSLNWCGFSLMNFQVSIWKASVARAHQLLSHAMVENWLLGVHHQPMVNWYVNNNANIYFDFEWILISESAYLFRVSAPIQNLVQIQHLWNTWTVWMLHRSRWAANIHYYSSTPMIPSAMKNTIYNQNSSQPSKNRPNKCEMFILVLSQWPLLCIRIQLKVHLEIECDLISCYLKFLRKHMKSSFIQIHRLS